MDYPQAFWDVYRKRWRARLWPWDENCEKTGPWTKLIIQAAKEACQDFAQQFGREINVYCERPRRIDVYAEDKYSHKPLVAFESETKSRGPDSWEWEFLQLCTTKSEAELRVLSGVFLPGTGRDIHKYLMDRLGTMRKPFIDGPQGDFCLVFGPDDTRYNREQPWMAFSLERNFTLRPLTSARLFIPRRVIEGKEPPTE